MFKRENQMNSHLFIWFVVIGIFMTLYTITGGMRLGFGLWYIFSQHDERECILRALRPHIDGSELWVLTAGGALFFLFPRIFFVVVSGFYPVISIIAILLFFRIIALALRNRIELRVWESFWDVCISVSTFIPVFLMGVIVGYILNGIPMYSQGRLNVNLMGYLSHYTIFSGLLMLFVTATLSCSLVAWKSDGIIRFSSRKWAFYSSLLVCVLFIDLSIWSLIVSPYISDTIRTHPYLYILPGCAFLATLTIPFLLAKRRFRLSLVMSIVAIAGLSGIFFVSIAPHLRTIFFEYWTPGALNRRIPQGSKAQTLISYRQKLLPYVVFVMVALGAFQLIIAHRFQRHVHCPLPFDEDDDSLL